MAAGGDDEKPGDLYAVLGLDRECSASDLKTAYKKLALKWHPDRCSATGNSSIEAKNKFQEIQEAYSVLSDTNKRFLYDLGIYESDNEDDEGMCEFLGEMAAMMTQTKPCETETVEESFEKLQDLFYDIFQSDMAATTAWSSPASACDSAATASSSSSESFPFAAPVSSASVSGAHGLKRSSCSAFTAFDTDASSFWFGANDSGSSTSSCSSRRRSGRKQKVRPGRDGCSMDSRRSAV